MGKHMMYIHTYIIINIYVYNYYNVYYCILRLIYNTTPYFVFLNVYSVFTVLRILTND